MKGASIITGLVVAAAGLESGAISMAMPNNEPGYAALMNVTPRDGGEMTLLELSDMQLASIVGGEVGNALQVPGSLSDDQSRQVNQIINQVLSGQKTNQSGSNTSSSSSTNTVQQNGDQVTVQQTQTKTQVNGPESVVTSPSSNQNNQTTSFQQVSTVTFTTQSDGTTKILVQQGAKTTTFIIPFPISSQALVNAIPFQVQVSVQQNIVRAIQELSGPMIGSPALILGGHR